MSGYENYVARADAGRARAVADTGSPFSIEVWFLGGLSASQRAAFAAAADRWVRVIVGDLPDSVVPTMAPEGHPVDDVLIFASGGRIDGPGQILGQAGPLLVRPESAGTAAFLPALGTMTFDTDDLERMEALGTLTDVITHEMGHVLGIGKTIWSRKGLLQGMGTDNPTFTGPATMAEYARLTGLAQPTPVPVENDGGDGSRDSHWREKVFGTELMSSRIGGPGNAMSRLTVASLADLGYAVDLEAAEKFDLPVVPEPAPAPPGRVQEIIPIVLG